MAGDREGVWPLFDVLADVKSGAFGLVLTLTPNHSPSLSLLFVINLTQRPTSTSIVVAYSTHYVTITSPLRTLLTTSPSPSKEKNFQSFT